VEGEGKTFITRNETKMVRSTRGTQSTTWTEKKSDGKSFAISIREGSREDGKGGKGSMPLTEEGKPRKTHTL